MKKFKTSASKIYAALCIMFLLEYLSVHREQVSFSFADFYLFVFIVLIAILLKVYTYVEIDPQTKKLKYVNVLVQRTTVRIDRIYEIGYSNKSWIRIFSYVYILYHDLEGRSKIVKIIEGSFSSKTLDEIVKLLKSLNQNIKVKE